MRLCAPGNWIATASTNCSTSTCAPRWRLAARLIPRLLKQGGGALAFVSSVAGYRGLPKAAAYGPTKAALINFAETLYLDLAPRGVSVFLINPGFVATPMTAANDFAKCRP
jgi:NAD(P)-dependent dehydrogenase (short-subunit alcohol dehydrogenase family)